MGSRISTAYRAEKVRMRLYNDQIEEDFRENITLLLLGSSGSGKSTLLKQINLAHRGCFSTSELADFRPTVYKNVLESAQAVVAYMRKIGLECADAGNKIHFDNIRDFRLDATLGLPLYFPPEIADAIHHLWKDPMVVKILNKRRNRLDLMDNADYFFSEVLRIGMPDYLPNEADVLRAYQKHGGITETQFSMGQVSLRIIDIGKLPNRKWFHYFEGVTSIMFCAAMSEYDQVLAGDKSQNRLNESILFFESLLYSRWFSHASVTLFLTKIDVFQKKLPNAPFEHYFPEYTGGEDAEKAVKYIIWRFMSVNRTRLSVYPHVTQTTTDTISVRLLCSVVNETTLIKELKARNLL